MKTFLSVLAALVVAFFGGRFVLAQDRRLEQWRAAKSQCSAAIQESFDRSKRISDDTDLSNALENGGRLYREKSGRKELIQSLIWFLEHKPGDLTDGEKAQLVDAKATLAMLDKSEAAQDAPTLVTNDAPKATPKSTPPSAAFLADVGYSQRAALKRYPDLAVKGGPLNVKFLARLAAC